MIKIVGDTHPGRVRDHNEDAILMDEARGLAVVADGMGGHASGEVASRLIVETFAEQDAVVPLADTLMNAHRRIVACAEAEPSSKGMGATVVAVQADTRCYRVSWVGDSRVYCWRRGLGLRQVSRDHSYLEWLLSQGEITEEEARTHPQRNVVTQGLGLNDPQPDSIEADWGPGDRLLLCSDGLTDELDDAQLDAALSAHTDIEAAHAALIEAALQSGGRDNISVIILENGAPAPLSAAPSPSPSERWRRWPLLIIAAAAVAGALWYLLRR